MWVFAGCLKQLAYLPGVPSHLLGPIALPPPPSPSLHLQLIRTLSAGDVDLAEQLMNYLLGRQVDLSYVVRMICIQGLGNMADINGSQVRGEVRAFFGTSRVHEMM